MEAVPSITVFFYGLSYRRQQQRNYRNMPPLKEAVPCITVIFDSLAYKRQQQRKYIECLL